MNIDITEKWAKEIALMSDAEFEENCKHIETLLSKRKQALRIHDVVGQSEQLKAFAKMVEKDDLAYLKDAETLLNDFESL